MEARGLPASYDVDTRRVAWRVSTRSDAGGGNCVEAGPVGDGSGRVAVRHSRQPYGHVLACGGAEWRAFTAGVKAGEFDFPGY